MFRIAYEKISADRFEVTLFCISQTISVPSTHFYHTANVNTNVVFGCKDVSVSTVLEIGFVFPVLMASEVI